MADGGVEIYVTDADGRVRLVKGGDSWHVDDCATLVITVGAAFKPVASFAAETWVRVARGKDTISEIIPKTTAKPRPGSSKTLTIAK